jgi:hypothetical protein
LAMVSPGWMREEQTPQVVAYLAVIGTRTPYGRRGPARVAVGDRCPECGDRGWSGTRSRVLSVLTPTLGQQETKGEGR